MVRILGFFPVQSRAAGRAVPTFDFTPLQAVSDSKLNATESPKLFATEKKSGDIIVLLLE